MVSGISSVREIKDKELKEHNLFLPYRVAYIAPGSSLLHVPQDMAFFLRIQHLS